MADYIDRGQALRLSEQVTQYDEGERKREENEEVTS